MATEKELDKAAFWLVIFITFLSGLLRIILLEYKGMWLEETFSVWMANHSVSNILNWVIKIDQHPPLYYLLLHYWITLNGDAPNYARQFSVLFGIGTIPVIYLIGHRMSGAKVGLVAALLLALSPYNIRFAQETRMYTLLMFNAAVAIYALVRLLMDARAVRPIGSQFKDFLHAWRTADLVQPIVDERDLSYMVESPRTGWRVWVSPHRWLPIQTIETDLAWVAFVIFSAATLYSHNTAILFLLATNIFVLGLMFYQRIKKKELAPDFQAPSFGNWLKAQIGIFLLWCPWIVAFSKQTSRACQEFWIPEPGWNTLTQTLKSFLNGSPLDQPMLIWILYVLVLGLGLWHYRKKLAQGLFLVTLFTIPFLGELVVSTYRPFNDRTLIWTTIPLLLLLASGIFELRFRYLVSVVVVVFSIINLFSAGDYFRVMQKEDWSTPAGYVANFAEPDDLVLFNSNFVIIPFDYYFREYENLYSIQVVKKGVPLDLFDDGVLEPKMTESNIPSFISLLDEHDRVWLVYSYEWCTDPLGLIPQILGSKMELTQQRNFYGGQVQLYETP